MRTREEIIRDIDEIGKQFEDHNCNEEDFCNRCAEAAAIHYALEDEFYALEDELDMMKENENIYCVNHDCSECESNLENS